MPSLARGADAADAEAQPGEVLALTRWSRRPSASRGEEEEPGSLLIRVPERTPVRIGACHPATLRTSPSRHVSLTPGTTPSLAHGL